VLGVELEIEGLHVDVTGGAAQRVCGQQDAAFEAEVLRVGCVGQSCQEPLQPVKREDLLDWALPVPGNLLQL
jgi:hypothetical protein